jgi:hypothetical protein
LIHGALVEPEIATAAVQIVAMAFYFVGGIKNFLDRKSVKIGGNSASEIVLTPIKCLKFSIL